MPFRSLLFVALLLAAAPARAEFEERILFAKGAWTVGVNHDTSDGFVFCIASTVNRQGQKFALVGYMDLNVRMFIFDGSWDLPKRAIDFLIDVDYSRWTMTGTGDGGSLSLDISKSEKGPEFLAELMKGNAIALLNTDERRLGTFSLSGSSAAIGAFVDCWAGITPGRPGNPFQTDSNPF